MELEGNLKKCFRTRCFVQIMIIMLIIIEAWEREREILAFCFPKGDRSKELKFATSKLDMIVNFLSLSFHNSKIGKMSPSWGSSESIKGNNVDERIWFSVRHISQ